MGDRSTNRATPGADQRAAVVAGLLARRGGFVPEWRAGAVGVDGAMTQVLARFVQAVAHRLEQAPDRYGLTLLDLLGVRLIPARAARAPMVFKLANTSQDARMPAGTRVAAPPPPGSNDQVIFELERATGVAVAALAKVVSVWPGRDQYIDHTAAAKAGTPFRPFARDELEDAPHAIYVAHRQMLALSGMSSVDISVELATPGSERLKLAWEFWDGKLWREFSNLQLDCDDDTANAPAAPDPNDGTGGLRRSGSIHLESEGGKAELTTVGGIESYWVRGRLDQRLPPDPGRILPEIDRLRLTAQISRRLELEWTPKLGSGNDTGLLVRVQDEAGAPLPGVEVASSGLGGEVKVSDDAGEARFQNLTSGRVSVTLGEARGEEDITGTGATTLTFRLAARGLKLDKAVAEGMPVDVTKPFLPFGAQPGPGSAFYFTNEEAFARPGARLRVFVQTAAVVTGSTSTAHTVSWEYWDGEEWRLLRSPSPAADAPDGVPDDFTATGFVGLDLVVPDDMAASKVANQEARWMRVRLASGTYADDRSITLPGGGTFDFLVSRPPVVARMLLGYTWPQGPYPADRVLAHNDFLYEDRTTEATWPGGTFRPFASVAGTPALYLGFDKPLPVDRVGLLFDIEELRGEDRGPALAWGYWDGVAWQALVADDETQHLAQPGIVGFIGQPDTAELDRFDATLHWVRAALVEDGPPSVHTMRAVYLNAAWAAQHLTVADEPLGTSNGQPNLVFAFRQRPVLPGQVVAVRELEGLRANVEWRIVVREALREFPDAVDRFDELLAAEGTQTDLEWRGVRLVRDRSKRVREVWVPWTAREQLLLSGPDDRAYVMDAARGRALFGDGVLGKVPPLGAAVVARQYRTGGGATGNLRANTITQLLAPIGGMESVFNALAAEGGSDTERPDAFARRGPATLHHRGRAVGAADYATLALESSAAIGRAWVLPATEPDGQPGSGWVTLVVVPKSPEPKPWPSFGLRDEVRQYVGAVAPAGMAAGRRLTVVGPDYLEVGVDAAIVPLDPAEAGAVKQRALDALDAFLHPLTGGPGSRGWEPGQPVYLADVATVLEDCPGVDHVSDLSLLVGATPRGDRAEVGPGRVAAAGDLRLRMVEE